MKDKLELIETLISNSSELVQEDYFDSSSLQDIEYTICHLRTLSSHKHRILARKIYSKLRDRISKMKDDKQKEKLIHIARLINMKVKSV
jgi:hypothetical protein